MTTKTGDAMVEIWVSTALGLICIRNHVLLYHSIVRDGRL